MISEDSTCTAAREVSSSAAASCSRQHRAEVCGVRHNFQKFMQCSGNKRAILRKNPAASKTHPQQKKKNIYGNSLRGPVSWIHTKGDTSDMAIVQPTEHPRTSPPRSRVSEHMPLYPSCVCLPEWAVAQAIATGALEA